MKHFRLIARGIEGLLLIYGSGLMAFAAKRPVVTHWNRTGAVDATGPAWQLLLLPLVLIVVGEIMQAVAYHRRQHDGTANLALVLPNEWRWVAGLVIIAVLFAGLMLAQIGIQF